MKISYSNILESALIPAYYRLRGRRYPHYRTLLERSQWWSPDQIQQFQWQELKRLLAHAFRNVPYYKQKYSAAGIELGDIRTPQDFAKLPPLTRTEVNAHRLELCASEPPSRLLPHATGGSSGVPTRFFITIDSYDWRCAASDRAYSWSGHHLGEKTFYLWGAPVGKVPAFKSAKMKGYRLLRREVVVSTFSQTAELWQETLSAVLRFKPRFIVGYVSSLEEFARFIMTKRYALEGVQAVIAAAEPVYERTRELVTRAFSAPLFNAYGSREFMSIAAECTQHHGLHVNSENILVETELPSPETPSEFLVTDLHNYGMPFIRYRIGDMGVMGRSTCPCGRGLPLLGSIEGRVLDMIRTRDGRVIPGEFFPHVLKDVCEICEFQVEQISLEEIVVSVVLSHPLSESSQTLLRDETAKVFGNDVRITVKPVETIPRRASGKRSVTTGLRSSTSGTFDWTGTPGL
jgi:phenylacetate-CoA ligase